tara:strand:- start:3163 stop:3516 length:354 start_codon:yes stop_codon:yes gene_type:complete
VIKISKSRLLGIIQEEMKSVMEDPEDKIKLKQRGISKGAQAAGARQFAKDVSSGEVAGEFTNLERSLVQQINDVITQIASAPDVDLGQYRAPLNTVLNRLKRVTGAELGDAAIEDSE